MTQILHSVGQNFRVVGPLTVANYLHDPSFESSDPNDFWDVSGACTLSKNSSSVDGNSHSGRLHFTSASGVAKHGIGQTLSNQVQQDSDYIFSVSSKIPSALPAGIMIDVNFIDPEGNTVSTDTGLLLQGSASAQWVRTSYLVTIPSGATQMSCLIYVQTDTSVNAIPDFYLDQAMIAQESDLSPYVDGNFSSYVWANDLYSSTLQSTDPTALNFFYTRGKGMGASAEPYYHNIIPVIS